MCRAAKSAFVWAIKAGASREEAAAAGGYALNSFYRAARRDPEFRAALDEAHAFSADAERGLGGGAGPAGAAEPDLFDAEPGIASLGGGGETRIRPNNLRAMQRRKLRNVRFDERRQQIFLAHFCWSCDAVAAAAAAGVCERTVYAHRRRDAVFAAAFQEALEQGYVRLEAELLRQRLEAQQRLSAAIAEAEPLALPGGGGAALIGELGAEFDRVMKLLARWDRRSGGAIVPGARVRPGAERSYTFDEAILLLEKRLVSLGHMKPFPRGGDAEGGAAEGGG